ncbi:MAG TPA: FtsX-like permease family protein [Rhizomicrobium sp.]|nr:FtsX-like permease family protein [Rhizomicrobium sp.]
MSLPRGRPTQILKFLPLIRAWLWRSPMRMVLAIISVAAAFLLYGVALGMAESFYRAAAMRRIEMGSDFLLGAMAVSAAGFALILLLVANAMAQSVRQRLAEFGILKAIGYSHALILGLVAAEAVLSSLTGAIVGLAAAKLAYSPIAGASPALTAIPSLTYTPAMLAVAALLALLLGILSAVPASRILRLEVVTTLAGALRADGTGHGERRGPAATASTPLQEPHQRWQNRLAEKRSVRLPQQIMAVTWVGLSTLHHRLRGVRTITFAVGFVAFVLLSFLCMGEGIRLGLLTSGDPARVVLTQRNLPGEEDKLVPQLAKIVANAPGVAHARDGAALVDGQYQGATSLIKRNNGNEGSANVVGVGPRWREMTPEFRLLSGRMPRPGAHELIAGDIARRKFSGLDDDVVEYLGVQWRIVGTFVASPWWTAYLIGDAATLKAAGKKSFDHAVSIRLTSPEAFEGFRRAVARKLPDDIRIERETDSYARRWKGITETAAAFLIAYFLATVAAIGATAAMAFTMQVAAEERARDIAVLRALGFDGIAIALSLAAEAMLLSLVGATAGTAVVWLWMDGFLYSGAGNVFRVTVNFHLLLVAIQWGVVVALAGVLRPAIRIARQTVMEALQEV